MSITFDLNLGNVATGVALLIGPIIGRWLMSGIKHLRAGIEGLYGRLDAQDDTLKAQGAQLKHNDECLDKLRETVHGLAVQLSEVKGAVYGKGAIDGKSST